MHSRNASLPSVPTKQPYFSWLGNTGNIIALLKKEAASGVD
jgi:hypothetical protein